jgi:hypothetical protein
VFVSALLNEARSILDACLRVAAVSELPAMGAQPVAERALIGREVFRRFRFADAELRDGVTSTGLSHAPCQLDRFLQVLAEASLK